MTEKEIKDLESLLIKLKADGLTIPNMPSPIWKAVHQVVSLPAVEVLVTRTGKDFLLNYRKDKNWDGYEIPGGFVGYKESLPEACDRVAKAEIGIPVKFLSVLTAYAWPDHPYGSPISIVCVCRPVGEPKQGQFFKEIPSPVVPHHGDFIKLFLEGYTLPKG